MTQPRAFLNTYSKRISSVWMFFSKYYLSPESLPTSVNLNNLFQQKILKQTSVGSVEWVWPGARSITNQSRSGNEATCLKLAEKKFGPLRSQPIHIFAWSNTLLKWLLEDDDPCLKINPWIPFYANFFSTCLWYLKMYPSIQFYSSFL